MTSPSARLTFRFGEFVFDPAAYELRRNETRIPLPRQSMDLLGLLLERAGDVVSRDEIVNHLWSPDVFVDQDAGIRTAVLRIRQALGESRAAPRFIETVSTKGYRFAGPVDIVESRPTLPLDAPERLPSAPRHNLPCELTSFVGRQNELTELRHVLRSSRLLLLTGCGGVGKSRLALRLVRDCLDEYQDGVWLIDLAPLGTPELAMQAIATVIGVRERPQRSVRDAVLEYLRARKMLLVFDTCEHLVDACAELAQAILGSARDVRIIATSREVLGVPGEVVYRVPTLPIPDVASAPVSLDALAASEAAELFLERAAAVEPRYSPRAEDAETILRICRRLDGIPLAIELAAARLSVLSVRQIEARLEDRFRLLLGATRTMVPRHRTLEATLSWSYQLLPNPERALLNRLSVFPASWSLPAAEHVASTDGIDTEEVLGLLSNLVSKSLISFEYDEREEHRYRMLDTIRQYARERLAETGEAARLGDRHFDYFFSQFQDALHGLSGPAQAAYLRRMQTELENIRAALEWGLSSVSRRERGVELGGGMFWFWTRRGLFEEGRGWLERAEAIPAPPLARSRVMIGLGHMAYFQGRQAEIAACNEEALSLGLAIDDAWAISYALFGQGLIKFERGELDEAGALAVSAREAALRSQEAIPPGTPLLILGNIAMIRGEHDRALQLFEQAVASLRERGEAWGLGIALSVVAGLRLVRRELDLAQTHALQAMALCEELEDPRGIAWCLDLFAALLASGGDPQAGGQLWGAADALLERLGGSLAPTVAWIRERHLGVARTSLGHAAFDAAHAEGRAISPEQAMALARRRARQAAGSLRLVQAEESREQSGS